jgi:hypothetical protein
MKPYDAKNDNALQEAMLEKISAELPEPSCKIGRLLAACRLVLTAPMNRYAHAAAQLRAAMAQIESGKQ